MNQYFVGLSKNLSGCDLHLHILCILLLTDNSGSTSTTSTSQYGGSNYKGGFSGSTVDVQSPGGGGLMRSSFAMSMKVQAYLASMSTADKTALGHQFDDLIIDCEFAGATCYSWYVNLGYTLRYSELTKLGCYNSSVYWRPVTLI